MGKPLITYEKGELYEQFVDEHEVFDHYYEVLVFFAVLGYREGNVKRENFTGSQETQSDAGLHNIHSRDLYHTIAACLAYQDTGKPEALVDPDEHKRVIAQYAAGGSKSPGKSSVRTPATRQMPSSTTSSPRKKTTRKTKSKPNFRTSSTRSTTR